MKNLTVVIETTNRCNLNCNYCYASTESLEDMSIETLESALTNLLGFENSPGISFIWHGGEPLLRGFSFFERIVELQSSITTKREFLNGVQTNGTLLDEQWLNFFETNRFRVSSSLDGPRDITNLTRKYPDGTVAYDDIFRGVKMLQKRANLLNERRETEPNHGRVRDLFGGLIAVIGKHNVDHIPELYEFFKEFSVQMRYNPVVDCYKRDCKIVSVSPQQYGQALCTLFDLWSADNMPYPIEPLTGMTEGLSGKPIRECTFNDTCRNGLFFIAPNGSVYPCDKIIGKQEFLLGNISQDNFYDIVFSQRHASMGLRSKQTVEGCQECDYGAVCNAGCMVNSYFSKGDLFGKDFFCDAYKMVFDHIKDRLKIKCLLLGGVACLK